MSTLEMTRGGQVTLHSIADRVEIAPGVGMPRLGLGTSRAYPGEVERAIDEAFALGYRSVDTAAAYRNEQAIGTALRRTGLARSEYFVTTKLWTSDQGYRSTLEALDLSLDRLGMEYVDLYLVHWPQAETTEQTWDAMEELLAQGLAKAIGVSNFMRSDLDQLYSIARVPPALDQFELHPWRQRPDLQEYCAEKGIVVQAWAPLMRGRVGEVPELVEIGRRHGKTPAQVALRWLLQKGVTTIPKTVHAERLRENASVFDFELDAHEMAAIDGLDRDAHAR